MRRYVALLGLLTALLVGCGTASVPPTPTDQLVATPASPAAAITAAPNPTAPPTPTASPRPVAPPTSSGSATVAGSPVSAELADVYARAARAFDRPGQLYHAKVRWDSWDRVHPPGWRGMGTTEVWIDAHRDVARLESQQVSYPSSVSIMTMQGRYTLFRHSGYIRQEPAPRCPGASLPVAVVFFHIARGTCLDASYTYSPYPSIPSRWATPTVTRGQGQYEGRPALVLVVGKGRANERSRLYLDPDTALPLGEETESGIEYATRHRYTWSAEFIPVDAVPPDFFDPAALR